MSPDQLTILVSITVGAILAISGLLRIRKSPQNSPFLNQRNKTHTFEKFLIAGGCFIFLAGLARFPTANQDGPRISLGPVNHVIVHLQKWHRYSLKGGITAIFPDEPKFEKTPLQFTHFIIKDTEAYVCRTDKGNTLFAISDQPINWKLNSQADVVEQLMKLMIKEGKIESFQMGDIIRAKVRATAPDKPDYFIEMIARIGDSLQRAAVAYPAENHYYAARAKRFLENVKFEEPMDDHAKKKGRTQ